MPIRHKVHVLFAQQNCLNSLPGWATKSFSTPSLESMTMRSMRRKRVFRCATSSLVLLLQPMMAHDDITCLTSSCFITSIAC